MKMQTHIKERIVRNVFLSLFIYLLPIALMLLSFWVTGERPWDDKAPQKQQTKFLNNKSNLNNGSND